MGWVSPQHEQTRGGLTRYQVPLLIPLTLTTPQGDRCYNHSHFTAADSEHREVKSLAQCHTAKHGQS